MKSIMRARHRQHMVACKIVLLLASMILLYGCPRGRVLPPPLPPGTISEEFTTEDVSRFINSRATTFQSLRGEGKVQINTWEEKYKFTEIFVLQTPQYFRLETLGAFSQPAVFLTSDGDSLLLYTKKHNTFYKGVPSRENLFKLSGINLSVEDTILVLSGNCLSFP